MRPRPDCIGEGAGRCEPWASSGTIEPQRAEPSRLGWVHPGICPWHASRGQECALNRRIVLRGILHHIDEPSEGENGKAQRLSGKSGAPIPEAGPNGRAAAWDRSRPLAFRQLTRLVVVMIRPSDRSAAYAPRQRRGRASASRRR